MPRREQSDRSTFALFESLAPLFNPLVKRLAGTRFLPFFAVLHHRGRRSGRVYATPVAARRTADGFVIPLAFGAEADWCRNILASGGCVIRWRGRDHVLVNPAIVDTETVLEAFSPLEGRIALLVGIRRVVRLVEDGGRLMRAQALEEHSGEIDGEAGVDRVGEGLDLHPAHRVGVTDIHGRPRHFLLIPGL